LRSKYLQYKDEILELFDNGANYNEISAYLIDTYKLEVAVDTLRKKIREVVHYLIADKDIIEYNIRLAKQKQKFQDLNRIERKSFREDSRQENALIEYNTEIIKLLNRESLNTKLSKKKHNTESVIVVQLADLHLNELVELESNKYDFDIASKRLQKYAYKVKEYIKFHKANKVLIAITGDLINSDRRLDEKLSMATNRAKATFLGVHLLKHFILDINEIAEVQVCCVTGNESRVNFELGWVDMVASDNYDFTIFEMLRLLLPDINFLRGDALELVVEINGKNMLVIHGHQLGRMDANQTGRIISKYSAKGVIIDLIICGHLHETMIRDNICRSASLVGSNAYSENALNLSGTAAQNIYCFTDDGRHDVRIDLQETKGWDGYNIKEELFAYNAKSVQKTHKKETIFKIII
jgi:predicted MPP superfamily phosphohydrolase